MSAGWRLPRWAAVRVIGLLAAASPVVAQELTYAGSLQFASGSYIFAERTSTFYLFNGLEVRAGRFDLGVSVPVVLQNSDVVTYTAGVPLPTGGGSHGLVRRRRSGEPVVVPGAGPYEVLLGDPLVSGSVELFTGFGFIRSIDLEAMVKPPVADLESGAGTGEWDIGAGGALATGVGRMYLFADAAYWRIGDLPDLELKDGLTYGLGLGRPVGGGSVSILASFAGSTRIVDRVDPPLSVGFGVGYGPTPGRSVQAGVRFGLTESAADLSLSLGWRARLAPGS